MKHQLLAVGIVIAAVASGPWAQAGTTSFAFGGAGISGSGILTYGPDTVVGDAGGAFAITNATGTFSDAATGLSDVAIIGVVPISPLTPPNDPPFPGSFSIFTVTNPTPPDAGISYDNLFYPGGSPIVCPTYPGAGGYLDIYGVMFKLANGYVVDLWSNGASPFLPDPLSYGVIVIDASNTIVATQADGISSAVPEPGSLCLLAVGLLGALGCRKLSVASRAKAALRD